MAKEKKITQREGARQIGITERHFRRLLRRFWKAGPKGITSGHRVRESNNRIDSDSSPTTTFEIKHTYDLPGIRF